MAGVFEQKLPDGTSLDEGFDAIMNGFDHLFEGDEETGITQKQREVKILADFSLHPGFKIYIKRMVRRRRLQRDKLETVSAESFAKEQARAYAMTEELNVLKGLSANSRKIILNEEEKSERR